MTKRAQQVKEKRILRARAALACLTPEERIALHREFGDCTCAVIVKLAVDRPVMTVGALAGALFVELLSAPSKVTTSQKTEDWSKLLGASK